MHKPSVATLEPMGDSHPDDVSRNLLVPVVEEVVRTSGSVPIPSLAPTPISDALSSGQSSSGSPREIVVASTSPGFDRSISSRVWVTEATKVKEGTQGRH